ncbi:nitroreductase family protein [Brevundimonas sp. AJA228-03]|uniref:Acg family FMN-binding oxidoreductase n=1 Tax=Brevundimonas sp. AJA228-03 TaxID=2752515 RepID=UPI001AE075B2|nr:nitroreductase family protein [Brevundimonas sp. AJA228-03]QTN20395.1 nitroreductase family protein [Brevundimonas sp. AJA228-03]
MGRRVVLVGGATVVAGGAGAAWLGVRGMGSMDDYDATVAQRRSVLSVQPELADLVRYATLAPNGHNAQPWIFRLGDGRIDILPDVARRTPVVDPDDHHLFVSLGGAAENLALAGAARGRRGEIAFDPGGPGGLAFSHDAGPPVGSVLFDVIPFRQSTRADYDGRPASAAELASLAAAARMPGVDVILITDRPRIDRLRDLVIEGNTAQLADLAFVRELKSWIRFNPRQALKTGDGLFSVASGNPPLPTWLGSAMFDATFKPKAENDKYARQIDTSAGVAVFVGAREDKDHWTRVGRSSQRFALQATALGLKCSHINQPVEVAALRPELAALVGVAGRRPDLVMRFGYGPTLPYAARRPARLVSA